jgi:hypothetical protein
MLTKPDLKTRAFPVKQCMGWLAISCLALAAIPTSAQVLYENGPINGTVDGWAIVSGYLCCLVTDSFALAADSTVTGFQFGAWEFPGDTMTSVDWSITSQGNFGTVYGSGTASGAN